MLSVHRIAFALALVVLASSFASGSECAAWRSQFGKSNRALKSKPQKMSIRSSKRTNGRWSKKIYDPNPVVIVSGQGACGIQYNDNDPVVLLWNGNKNDLNGGWGNGNNLVNCNKQVYIQANGATVYAVVVDFGTMNIRAGTLSNPSTLQTGCSAVWATQAVFDQLGFNSQQSSGVLWDFAAFSGDQPQSHGH